jgi:D-sedoheptulose 7-phosphate isomerase
MKLSAHIAAHFEQSAKERNMCAIAPSSDGNLVELLGDKDIHIGVPYDNTSRIQAIYFLILHCLCDATDCLLLGAN